jgi:hypothetical protein
MDENPYLPPDSRVVDAVLVEQPPAFAVSTTKFVVMCVATLNLYTVYWFYKHWVAIRRRTGDKVSPVWRAIFSIIWAYSCFQYIEVEARKRGLTRTLSAGGLAAGWAILNLLARLPDPFWLVSLLAFLFLLPVQSLANELNAKVAPGADRNARFTLANIVWLVFAALMWLLLIVGLAMPDQPPG